MAIVYTDNFTDTNGTLIHNHTADTGQSYSTNTGMEIQSNRVLFTNTTTKIAKIESMTLATDYTIELDLYKHTNAGNIGINFGVTTSTATDVGYGIYFRVLSNGDLSLVRVNQFGSFALWTWNPGVADNTALSTVKLEVTTGGGTGRGIRVFYGGVEQHFNESTVSAGDSLYIRSFTAVTSTTGHHITRLEYNDTIPPPPSNAIPVLTLPTVSGITATNVDVGFDTDQTDGTAYVLFNNNASAPAAATVVSDGQVSDTIVGSGVKSISWTDALGLDEGRNYFAHIVHNNSFGNSNVLTTDIFAIPTLSNTYLQGSYTLAGGATAPDSSTDSDTGTLDVTPLVEGNINATTEDDTWASTASVINHGSFNIVMDSMAWSGSASLRLSGSLNTTTDDMILTALGTVPIGGSLAEVMEDFRWRGSFIPSENRGSINQIAYYLLSTGEYQSTQANDIIKEWLLEEGYVGAINQMLYNFLGDAGYNGTLQDRMITWSKEP